VHRFSHRVAQPHFTDEAGAALREAQGSTTVLPHGMGRSYGDSCLNQDGGLLITTSLDRFVAFDRARGTIECEAGVTLAAILALLEGQAPGSGGQTWFLPVTPGTKFVTIGGAIANDVHGKNHHVAGCFGEHVEALRLLRSNGEVVTATPTQNTELFKATIGGLGLTGLILSARLKLLSVPGLWMEAEDVRFPDLDAFYRLSDEALAEWDYGVAWIDCVAGGAKLGRGVFTRSRHAEAPRVRTNKPRRPLAMPVELPEFLLNPYSIGAFNTLLWHKAPAAPKRRLVGYDPIFYPLDSIHSWNRMYGPRGMYQYQCAVPEATARPAIRDLLKRIAASGEGSFLAVLKTFGDRPSPGMMSFPMPGVTLALDFPNRGPRTLAMLEELDAITMAAGGRIYPAKDGRVSAAAFQAGYPQWREFARFVDPGFSSSFWRRVSAAANPA
jgi:FAD/FMN-containing dehydrogenase